VVCNAATKLEAITFAFAILNGITAWLCNWWHKPSDIWCAVLSLPSLSIRQYDQHAKTTDILAPSTLTRQERVRPRSNLGMYVRSIDLDWKTLTDFQGTNLSLNECSEIIRRAPNLTAFTAESIKEQDDPFLLTPPSITT